MEQSDRTTEAAQQQPEAAPLHLGACITDGKLYATVIRFEIDPSITVVATAEMDVDALRKGDCQALMCAEPSDKLDAPAQVGNTVFRKGVTTRLVIEAAHRNYQRIHNPTEEDKRIAAATAAEPEADERAAFEAWAKKEFDLRPDGLTRRGNEYKYTAICDAWAAWQARAAQSGQRAGVGLPIKGACIDGGYVIVTPSGTGNAAAVKAAILALAAPKQQQEGNDV